MIIRIVWAHSPAWGQLDPLDPFEPPVWSVHVQFDLGNSIEIQGKTEKVEKSCFSEEKNKGTL